MFFTKFQFLIPQPENIKSLFIDLEKRVFNSSSSLIRVARINFVLACEELYLNDNREGDK